MNIFDRNAKYLQRERAASDPEVSVYDYLKEEIGYRLNDRIFDIKREFDVVLDLGSGRGHATRHITDDIVKKKLIHCDVSNSWLDQANTPEGNVNVEKLNVDEEKFQLPKESVDLVISNLSLHWINNLPEVFRNVHNCLKADGPFLASMFGGETLYELRCSLQMAEVERQGGFGPHISPFVTTRDLGGLLGQAGFTLLTIDCDELVVGYPSIFDLMRDLKGMAENNCAWNRRIRIHKDTLLAAEAIYHEMYGNPDEKGIPATFQIFYFIGWKPHPSQPKPLDRGSGNVSLKDLPYIEEILKK